MTLSPLQGQPGTADAPSSCPRKRPARHTAFARIADRTSSKAVQRQCLPGLKPKSANVSCRFWTAAQVPKAGEEAERILLQSELRSGEGKWYRAISRTQLP